MLSPDSHGINYRDDSGQDNFKSQNLNRVIWVMSKSSDHYMTWELAAGKQLFNNISCYHYKYWELTKKVNQNTC